MLLPANDNDVFPETLSKILDVAIFVFFCSHKLCVVTPFWLCKLLALDAWLDLQHLTVTVADSYDSFADYHRHVEPPWERIFKWHWSGATRGHMSPIAVSPAIYYHSDVILIMTSRAYGGARSPVLIIDREFEFYYFFIFKIQRILRIFFRLKKICKKIVILQIIDV